MLTVTLSCPSTVVRLMLTFEAELMCHCFCLLKDQVHNSDFGTSFPQRMSKGSPNSLPSAGDVGHFVIQAQPVKDAALVITPEDVIPHHFFLKQRQTHISQQGAKLSSRTALTGSACKDEVGACTGIHVFLTYQKHN